MANSRDGRPDEETPLLASDSPQKDAVAYYRRRVIVACFIMMFLLDLGLSMTVPALNSVLEDRICREVYPDLGDIPQLGDGESRCKSPEVQGRLAILRGWQTTLDCIPSILTTIPFGLLADKWGRKNILFLSLVGILLYILYQLVVLYFETIFPVNAILASFVFMMIGGGAAVFSAMLFTLISDVVPVVQRATMFFQLIAFTMISEIVAGPLAGLIMLKSDWAALITGAAIFLVALIVCLFIPETLDLVKVSDATVDENSGTANEPLPDECIPDTAQAAPKKAQNGAGDVWTYLRQNGLASALILSLVFVVLSKFVQELLLQYTTKRYHWTWSQATFLLTIRSITNLVVLCVILPAATQFALVKLKWHALEKDLWLARFSGLAGICGSLFIAFAFEPFVLCIGLVILGFSAGLGALIRSLLNNLVEPEHNGMMNTLIGLMEIIGVMIAAPTLSNTLKVGLDMGGVWIGLPFMCAAAILTVSTSIMWLIRVPSEHITA